MWRLPRRRRWIATTSGCAGGSRVSTATSRREWIDGFLTGVLAGPRAIADRSVRCLRCLVIVSRGSSPTPRCSPGAACAVVALERVGAATRRRVLVDDPNGVYLAPWIVAYEDHDREAFVAQGHGNAAAGCQRVASWSSAWSRGFMAAVECFAERLGRAAATKPTMRSVFTTPCNAFAICNSGMRARTHQQQPIATRRSTPPAWPHSACACIGSITHQSPRRDMFEAQPGRNELMPLWQRIEIQEVPRRLHADAAAPSHTATLRAMSGSAAPRRPPHRAGLERRHRLLQGRRIRRASSSRPAPPCKW